MKRKDKGRPKKLKLTEDQLTELVLHHAIHSRNINPRATDGADRRQSQRTQVREQAAHDKARRLQARRENC